MELGADKIFYAGVKEKKCYFCGYDWPHGGVCPAKMNTCCKCNKKGHFEAVCKTPGRTVTTSAIIISAIESICGSSQVQVSNLPLVNVMVGHGNKIPEKIECVADTGAQASVAGLAHMKRLGITQT